LAFAQSSQGKAGSDNGPTSNAPTTQNYGTAGSAEQNKGGSMPSSKDPSTQGANTAGAAPGALRLIGGTSAAGKLPTIEAANGVAAAYRPRPRHATIALVTEKRSAEADCSCRRLAQSGPIELPFLADFFSIVGFARRIERRPPALLPSGTAVAQIDWRRSIAITMVSMIAQKVLARVPASVPASGTVREEPLARRYATHRSSIIMNVNEP